MEQGSGWLNRAHVCEFCLGPHRAIESPQNPGWTPPAKGVGKGKGKNKSKQWVCVGFGHHRVVILRPLDSSARSVTSCPKMSEDDDAHLGCARGVPSNSAGVKGGVPLGQAQSMRCISLSDRRFTIKGVFCEVARTESNLEGTLKEDGVAIHSLSGGVDLQLQESRSIEGGCETRRNRLVPLSTTGHVDFCTLCAHQVCEVVSYSNEVSHIVEHGRFRFV